MKKRLPLAICALMTPAITLGIGSAFAQAPTTSDRQQQEHQQQEHQQHEHQQHERQQHERQQQDERQQQKRSTQDRQQQERSSRERQESTLPGQDRDDQRMAGDRSQQHGEKETFLSSKPSKSFRLDELMGSDLKSRSDDENIGSVSDVLIDEDGKIAAVIVEVGGFLGIGEKEVAISWDSVERTSKQDREGTSFGRTEDRSDSDDDEYEFTVDATKDELENAPEFKEDSDKRRGQRGR